MSKITGNSSKGWKDTEEGRQTLEMIWDTSGQPVIPQDSDLKSDTEADDDSVDLEEVKRKLQAKFAREAEEEKKARSQGSVSTGTSAVGAAVDDSKGLTSKISQSAKTARPTKWKPMTIGTTQPTAMETAAEDTQSGSEVGWTVVSDPKKDRKALADTSTVTTSRGSSARRGARGRGAKRGRRV